MASHGALDWKLLIPTLIGTALTAAAASVLNQIVGTAISTDALMPRTRNRPMAAGRLAVGGGAAYEASGLASSGVILLCCW